VKGNYLHEARDMGKISLVNPSVKYQPILVSQQTPKHFLNRRTNFATPIRTNTVNDVIKALGVY
jgi:hypothetical protein